MRMPAVCSRKDLRNNPMSSGGRRLSSMQVSFEPCKETRKERNVMTMLRTKVVENGANVKQTDHGGS